VNDRVFEGFIHNLSKRPDTEIRNYLQDEGFLHVSCMLDGYKLDPTLLSALVERWRPETHTFHLSCGECTITLKDVALQLCLLVDGPTVIGLVVVLGKKDFCEEFLGKVLNKFQGGRIAMKWLETNFKELPPNTPNIVKEQYARAFILRLIGGILMLDKSQILDVNMSLIVYAMVEMHESDRVMQQFKWRQKILPPPITDKPYLLSVEVRSWQLCQKRPRQPPHQRRSGGGAATGSSQNPTQQAPRYLHHILYIFRGTSVLSIVFSHAAIDVDANAKTNAGTCIDIMASSILSSMPVSMPKLMPMYLGLMTLMTLHSSTEEGDGDKDEDEAEMEMKMKMKTTVEMKMSTRVEVKTKMMITTKRRGRHH
ncbi:hypothetical protein Gotri_011522, partial [Gossypium trilobum]|nr:hypothetical protein [Gossypium trilobum]